MRWVWVLVVACSTPPSPPLKPWAPDDDGVAERPAPPPGPAEYTFDWNKVRASNEAWMAHDPENEPCDPRRRGHPPPGVDCIPSGHKLEIAALAVTMRPAPSEITNDRHRYLLIDRGRHDATLTTDWFAAVLDDRGRPRTSWAHLAYVKDAEAALVIDLPIPGVEVRAGETHVAVVQEVPK